MATSRNQPALFNSAPSTLWCGEVEAWAERAGYGRLIGLDEAGRGPLAGPVVAAAVCLPDDHSLVGLDDSKRLSERARDALFPQIQDQALAWAVAVVEPDEIDQVNILQASLIAMGRAWTSATERTPSCREALALVDGNQRAHLPGTVEQRPIVKGDARSTHIAAASILAKVTRDRRMLEEHQRWPVYGFAQHKGYPTAMHREAIRVHGPCPIHRRSFRLPEVATG